MRNIPSTLIGALAFNRPAPNPQVWQSDSELWETVQMASLENHIDRILGEAKEPLTAIEITLRLNAEFNSSANSYQIGEIVACANKMPNLIKSGKQYLRKPENPSQAAARIVKEATEDH